MKHIAFSLCLLAATGMYTPFSYAQEKDPDGSGVYLTAGDYLTNKLSYQGARVRADIPFRQKAVKVIGETGTKDLSKGEVFGYRDKHGQDYRFFDNKAYKIVDKAHFPLYRRVETVSKGKERTRKTLYYFSATPGSELQPLTVMNLKKAFPANDKFHQLLDLQFRHDKDLIVYDNFRQEYKVKAIFNSAFNEDKALVQGE